MNKKLKEYLGQYQYVIWDYNESVWRYSFCTSLTIPSDQNSINPIELGNDIIQIQGEYNEHN